MLYPYIRVQYDQVIIFPVCKTIFVCSFFLFQVSVTKVSLVIKAIPLRKMVLLK